MISRTNIERVLFKVALIPLVLLSVTAPAAGEPPDTTRLAVVGGTIIPATGATVIRNGVVLISDGRIERVGASVKIPDGYRKIDARGKWVTPGLIDTNAHLILTTVPEFFVKYEDRLEAIALQSAQVALKYGMTTIGDTWGPLEPLLAVRDRINAGEEIGTRVLVAGNIIGCGGPFTAYFMKGWDVRGDSIRYGGWVHPDIQRRIDETWEAGVGPNLLAMTPEEIGDALRAYIARGVDFIKVCVSGHSLGAVEPLMFSDEALAVMRNEARRAGIPFTTHTFSVASLRQAIDVGADFLLHPNVMSVPYAAASRQQRDAIEALAAEAAAKGIQAGLMAIPNKEHMEIMAGWDPRAHPQAGYLNRIMLNRGAFVSDDGYEKGAEGVRIWIESGVEYTIATDQGPESADLGPTVWGRLGRAHFERMEALQQLGEEPADILIAATRNGAAAYRLDGEFGTIEEGKIADLLIVDADPHRDIANLRQIHAVIKDGQVVDRSALPTEPVLDYDPEAEWPF
ncbi:MAG: amidohydrolase family protein [Pseudomonadota bacterium]